MGKDGMKREGERKKGRGKGTRKTYMNTLSFAAALIAIILPSHLVRSDGSSFGSFPSSLPQIYTLIVSLILDEVITPTKSGRPGTDRERDTHNSPTRILPPAPCPCNQPNPAI
jgi:hypothetical protein